jgi:hypothetical protein
MPLVDSNDPTVWSSTYRVYVDGVERGYERAAKDRIMGEDPDRMVEALVRVGLQKGQRIALIGCGFGWMAEQLVELGYGPIADGTASGRIVNVDTSTWIHANKANNAVIEILNQNINASTGRRAVKSAFGSPNAVIDWAISEDVLPILTDSEVSPFCSALRQAAVNVAHWVSVLYPEADQDTRMNWKTLADWKTLVAPDHLIERGGSRIL